jgi:hypothetical protein
MRDRPGSFLGCASVRTKCIQKTHVGLWGSMIYDPRELPGVSNAGPGVDGVLLMILESTLTVSRPGLGVQAYSVWRMWARSGPLPWHMTTLNTQTWPRGDVFGLALTDKDVSLLKEGEL